MAVDLSLEIRLCEPITYVCGTKVDVLATRGPSREKESKNRKIEKNRKRIILRRALNNSNILSIKKTLGLVRINNKRPDWILRFCGG